MKGPRLLLLYSYKRAERTIFHWLKAHSDAEVRLPGSTFRKIRTNLTIFATMMVTMGTPTVRMMISMTALAIVNLIMTSMIRSVEAIVEMRMSIGDVPPTVDEVACCSSEASNDNSSVEDEVDESDRSLGA